MDDNSSEYFLGSDDMSICDVYSHPKVRLAMLSVGTLIAFVGCVCNLFLLTVFIVRRHPRSSLYLTFLAFLDFMLCFLFIQLFGLLRYSQVFRIEPIYTFITSQQRGLLVMSRVVQLSIPYVLIASSAERLYWISGKGSMSSRGYSRVVGCTLIALVSILLRAPTYMAIEIQAMTQCDFFFSMNVAPTEFGRTQEFFYFDFIVQFFHLFVSFIILSLLNYVIVRKLKMSHKNARRQSACTSVTFAVTIKVSARNNQENDARREHKRLRCAIRTTIVVISSYLACNAVNFVLYLCETLYANILFDENEQFKFEYVLASDLGTILFVLSSAIRIFIYYKYNPELRAQMRTSFPFAFYFNKRRQRVVIKTEEDLLQDGTGNSLVLENTSNETEDDKPLKDL